MIVVARADGADVSPDLAQHKDDLRLKNRILVSRVCCHKKCQ